MTDLKSGCGRLSQQARSILKIDDDNDASFEKVMSVVHQDDRSFVKAAFENAISTKSHFDIEHRLAIDGLIKWVRGRGKVECDESGLPQTIIGTMQDITNYRDMMEKLRESMIRAEAANSAKSEFLAVMTHELRTPLNGIIGYNELMLMSNLDAKQQLYAKRIKEASEGLLTIIADILDFSSLEEGKLSITAEEFSPKGDIVGALQLIKTIADEKGLSLSININDNVPKSLSGDFGKIRQIITNIVGNAVKFTEKGVITIDIDWEHPRAEGAPVGNLLIAISDTGIGIPDDKIQLLFEKFQQLDPSSARRYEGIGLGLAICKKLCEAMGGEISVESKLGVGSTFGFSIPCQPVN